VDRETRATDACEIVINARAQARRSTRLLVRIDATAGHDPSAVSCPTGSDDDDRA
jgi:hypothetical protein